MIRDALTKFSLPLITGIALGSGLVQFLFAGRSVGQENVVLICASHEQAVLQNEINCLPVPRRSLLTLLNDRDQLLFVNSVRRATCLWQ